MAGVPVKSYNTNLTGFRSLLDAVSVANFHYEIS